MRGRVISNRNSPAATIAVASLSPQPPFCCSGSSSLTLLSPINAIYLTLVMGRFDLSGEKPTLALRQILCTTYNRLTSAGIRIRPTGLASVSLNRCRTADFPIKNHFVPHRSSATTRRKRMAPATHGNEVRADHALTITVPRSATLKQR